jgi:putative sugar O-methyltransferase
MTAKQIQETLFQKYYLNDQLSEVTSSPWSEFGRKTTVKQSGDGFDFNASGISAFARKKIPVINTLKHYPIDFLLHQLLKKHHGHPETIQAAKLITQKLKIHFDFDHAKHVLIYDLLNSYGLFNTENLICIIGDGHGFFGTLIKSLSLDAKIIFINLGRNLLIDTICFSKIFPNIEPLHYHQPENFDQIKNNEIIFLEAEQFELLQNLPISLFINVASMQEMNLQVVHRYFELMRTSTVDPYFYCNNREEKTLPDGSVICFNDYPWGDEEIFIDELCPFYQYYPSSRPPFWRPFDGPIRHRLVKL